MNYYTPQEICSVQYKDLDHAVRAYLKIFNSEVTGRSDPESDSKQDTSWTALQKRWRQRFHQHKVKKIVYAGKSDIKSAFRILGLSPDSWPWLLMRIQNPVTLEWVYFVDKCLPFGASISCALFQSFSDALCHIFEHRTLSQGCNLTTNYLDDFLFIALMLLKCNALIKTFLSLCEELGVPISLEKTEWAAEVVIFLGILLDGRNLKLGIPLEK